MADTENGAAEQPAEDDLRSLLSESFDKAERGQETPAVAADTEGATAPVPATEGRQRGPDGKFLPAEAKEATDAPVAAVVEDKPAETASSADADKAAAVEAPTHWSQADKDWLVTIPPEHRKAVLDRFKAMESGFTPKLQRAAEIERNYGPAADIFTPHMETLRQQGKTPSDVIRSWAGVEQGLLSAGIAAREGRSDDTGASIVANLITGYQIDPAAVARILTQRINQPAGQTQPQQRAQPELSAVVEARLRALEEGTATEALSRAQAQIDAFSTETNADGSLKRPHFVDVKAEMEALARIDRSEGRVPDLAKLYDRAIRLNDSTYQKLLAAEKASEAKRVAGERTAKAEAARKAGSSVTGAPGPGQSQGRSGGERPLRDELAAAFDEHAEA